MLLLTLFFSIWFPKAGVKFSGIPLTVSNVLFGITFILWFLKNNYIEDAIRFLIIIWLIVEIIECEY